MAVWVTWPGYVKLGSLGIMAGLLTLGIEREELLKNNLFDVEDYATANAQIVCDERSLSARTEDGTCNILENPAEGSVYMRFGRNVNTALTQGETEQDTLLIPNPREVSNVLLTRSQFKPATSLNFIAGAWIQFMVHDWVSHGENNPDAAINVPLPAGDSFGSGSLTVQHSQHDVTGDPSQPAVYRNVNTHWWDGSQLYGSSKTVNNQVRAFTGGRLKVDADGSLPLGNGGVPVTGFSDNWWLGLSMMHRLFTQEHNAIADMLHARYPDKDDQWLYDKARLVNAALMAKIHTIEWTPAIIANPVTERAMHANWYGIIGDRSGRDAYQDETRALLEDLQKTDSLVKTLLGINSNLSGDVGSSVIDHALAGLVGSARPDNAGTPYTLTEEFVSVYRMHPLMRDNVKVYDIGTNIPARTIALQNTRDGNAEEILDDESPERLWFSFGITHPGALTLNNYPDFLRNLSVPFVGKFDLATVDILRDRERGVPRYNEFRREIGLNPITKFEDLTSDATQLANLKRLYNNDIEQIDTMVGMMAETVRPEGFGFGETAFQIFILNASRRLMTDRFYTQDYTPEVYTPEGMDWVENNSMIDVLKRHYPQLNDSLVGVENAFKPWGLHIPEDYQSWAAADKEKLLWGNGVQRTQYVAGSVPALEEIDIGGLIDSILWKKVQDDKDVAPAGYSKPLHAHGAMAKVKFVPVLNNGYTGLFQGAKHGLLRLSVTGDPADRGFAPGFAWKVFVDGKPSENVSGLYTLSGQGTNHNYFANELSNYVSSEVNESLGTTILFSLVSSKPTRLMVDDMAKVTQAGAAVASPKAPTQIYLVPRADLKSRFSSAARDFRNDLVSLKSGVTVYDVYATSMEIKTSIFPYFNNKYANERRASAKKIGELRLTSDMTLSAFGDNGVFFKHQRYEDK